jgi:hypothetical protein
MAEPAPAAPNVSPDEARRLTQCAQRWIGELGISEKAQRHWLEKSRKIVKRYRFVDSDKGSRTRQFNMLWSNTQTLFPATYFRPPQPVVTRRFNDQDPVARVASEVLERSLSYSIDKQGFHEIEKQAALDYVLLARGQTWERYEPTFGPEVIPEIPLQVKTEGDGDDAYTDESGNKYEPEQTFEREGQMYAKGEPYRPVEFEESITDYVNWEDFGHSVARTWDEVDYVWRRVYLSRKQLVERFGAIGKLVPLDWGPVEQGRADEAARLQKKAAVYEIWCKSERKVYWVSKSYSSRPLDERDDPLGLDGFFPCPKPLLGTTANDSVIPVPDYVYYQDQAEEIDVLTQRISELQKDLKLVGFYAGDAKNNLNNLLSAPNNKLLPVPDWITFKEGGGIGQKIEFWPIDMAVQALEACVTQRQVLIQNVYEITGVADIMRGMNDPRSTATAERIKGAWGTLRVRDRQMEVMRFARDQLRIKGEVIAEKFDVETLKAMSGVQIPTDAEKQQAQAMYDQGAQQYQMAVQQAQMTQQPPPPQPEVPPEIEKALSSPTWEEVSALLRDNAARQFRIDIETDSTIEPDEAEEKAQAVEFIGAVGQMIQQWGPAIQAAPALAPMASAFIKWGARRFRAGRELEDTIERVMDQIAASPPQQPQEGAAPPDNSLQVAQVKAQADLQKEQMKQTGEDGRAHIDASIAAGEQRIQEQELQLNVIALNRDPKPQSSV